MDALTVALGGVPVGAWSQPSTYAQTRVHHGYRRVDLVSGGKNQSYASLFGFVLDGFAPVAAAWLSWIDPGGFIVPHRDGGPWRERWQVPISTAGRFHGRAGATNGVPFRVKHWEPHAVINDSDLPRIHLVIDRAVWVDTRREPFRTFPVPPEMADLVARSWSATSA